MNVLNRTPIHWFNISTFNELLHFVFTATLPAMFSVLILIKKWKIRRFNWCSQEHSNRKRQLQDMNSGTFSPKDRLFQPSDFLGSRAGMGKIFPTVYQTKHIHLLNFSHFLTTSFTLSQNCQFYIKNKLLPSICSVLSWNAWCFSLLLRSYQLLSGVIFPCILLES